MNVLGLDEAGRGCVLGPLVVAAFCCEESDLGALRKAGAADSKTLSPARRARVADAMQSLGTFALLEFTPAEIDATNINALEESAFVQLVNQFEPGRATIDAPVHPRGIAAFVARLRTRLHGAPALVVEPKADATYAEVGAASIVAKLHRDARIAEIDAALGPVGSGYPSDPVTRAWLHGHLQRGGALPPCVRTRWGTIENLRQEALFGR